MNNNNKEQIMESAVEFDGSEKQVKRIREFYKPRTPEDRDPYFVVDGNKRYIAFHSSKPLYLSFGGQGIPIKITSIKSAWADIDPEGWERIRNHYHDKRTEAYLNAIKKNIGLTGIQHGWNSAGFEKSHELKVWVNTDPVEVGKKGEQWVAEYGVQTDIDDYDICSMFFNKGPTREMILTATKLETIRNFFMLHGYEHVTFTCWECGRECHWLDIDLGQESRRDLHARWDAYWEHYCGC